MPAEATDFSVCPEIFCSRGSGSLYDQVRQQPIQCPPEETARFMELQPERSRDGAAAEASQEEGKHHALGPWQLVNGQTQPNSVGNCMPLDHAQRGVLRGAIGLALSWRAVAKQSRAISARVQARRLRGGIQHAVTGMLAPPTDVPSTSAPLSAHSSLRLLLTVWCHWRYEENACTGA
jgi:hypothetical protein